VNPTVKRPAGSRLRAWAELVRVFLTPTVLADSHAGLFVAAAIVGGTPSAAATVGVAALSTLVYWSGMVANDIFDLPRDVIRAPHRPIPSARISLGAAAAFLFLLLVGAIALGALLGIPALATALLLVVLAYDAGGKDIPFLGNILMGLCRGGNFLLGAATLAGTRTAVTEARTLAGAAILTLFVACITAVSRLEDAPFNIRMLRFRALPILAVPLVLALLRVTSPFLWIDAALLALLLILAARSASGTRGATHGAAVFVRQALGGIFLLDSGIVLALGPEGSQWVRPVATLYVLFVIAVFWRRAWVRRGGEGS